MNKIIFEGKWEEIKGQLKEKWGKLTTDDLKTIEGEHEALIGKLKQYYGYSKDQSLKAIKKFQDLCR